MENNTPVGQWLHDDIHVWPIARHYLFKHALARYAHGFLPPPTIRSYARLFHWRSRIPNLLTVDRDLLLKSDGGGSGAILLVGNHAGVTRIGGSAFQHHLDPYRIAAAGLGIDTTMLLAGESNRAIAGRYRLDAPTYSLRSLYRHLALRGSFVPVTRMLAPELGRLVEQVAASIGTRPSDLAHHIDIAVCLTAGAAPLFQRYLEMRRTRAVLVYNFASFVGWSLAHACRRLAIPMADVQHGVQGAFNGSYLVPAAPPGGWNVMPPGAIVWSEGDRARFERSEPGGMQSAGRAIVAGPGSLMLLKSILQASPPSRFRPMLAAVASALKVEMMTAFGTLDRLQRPRILFAAQTAPVARLIGELARTGSFSLLYRVHPVMLAKGRVQQTDHAATNALMAFATRTPLPVLLAGVDGLVTEHSAAFLDAARLGVPSLLISELARLIAADYEDEYTGLLHFVDNDPTAIAARLACVEANAQPASERLQSALAGLPNPGDVLAGLLERQRTADASSRKVNDEAT